MSTRRRRMRVLGGGGGVAVPEAPNNLTITGIDGDSVVLDTTPEFTWDAVDGADTYTLQYDDDIAFGSPVEVTEIATNSYTPSALTGAKRYARVRGVNAGGNGAWSDTLTFIIPYIYDTFTAANGTNLNGRTPDITTAAATWSVVAGSFSVNSNQALAGNDTSLAQINAGQSDVTFRCDVTTGETTTTNFAQLVVRYTDSTHMWLISISENLDALELYEFNTSLTLRDSEALSLAQNTQYTLTVTVSGTSISAAIGAAAVSFTSSFNQSATRFGIRCTLGGTVTNRPRWDNARIAA